MLEVGWDNLDEAFAAFEAEVTDIVRGLTVDVFYRTLKMSPQYFGRYVSSWTYKIGSPEFWSNPDFDYEEEDQGYAQIYKKGSWEPIYSAILHSMNRDSGFKLGDTVYISNGVDHGEGPYAEAIEAGLIKLRMVNQPGKPLTRAIDQTVSWFSGDMNPRHAAELRAMRIY